MARSPLIDLYDPYGMLTQQAALGILRGRELGDDRDLTIEDLVTEEDKQSNMAWLADGAMTGLGAAAYGLDTLGAGVRGLLAGKPSSVFGNSQERVSGRDLLRQYGLIGDEDTTMNFIGGLLTEVATDPLTYINPFSQLGRGAATTGGKLASKAGLMKGARATAKEIAERKGTGLGYRETLKSSSAQDLIDQLDKSIGGVRRSKMESDFIKAIKAKYPDATPEFIDDALTMPLTADFGAQIPLTGISGSFNLPGVNAAFLGDTLERVGLGNRFIAPIAARGSALFDTDVQGFYKPGNLEATLEGQDLARAATRDYAFEAQRLLGEEGEFLDLYNRARGADTSDLPEGLRSIVDTDIERALRDYVEDPFYAEANRDLPAMQAIRSVPEFRALRDYLKDYGERMATEAKRSGRVPPQIGGKNRPEFSPLGYLPRQRKEFVRADLPDPMDFSGGQYRRKENIFSSPFRSRADSMDIPAWMMREFTSGEKGAALQAALRNATDKEVPAILDAAYREAFEKGYGKPATDNLYSQYKRYFQRKDPDTGKFLDPDFAKAVEDDTRAKLLGEPEVAVANFLNKVDRDANNLYLEMADRLSNVDKQFGSTGAAFFDAPLQDTMVKAIRATAKDKSNANAIYKLLDNNIIPGKSDTIPGRGATSLKEAANKLGLDTASPQMARIIRRAGEPLKNLSILDTDLDVLKTLLPESRIAEPASGILGAINQFTNLWKVGALTYPSYATRNLYSGYINNLVAGAGNPLDFIAASAQSRGYPEMLARRLKNVPGYEYLDEAERLKKFDREAAAQGIVAGNVSDMVERPVDRLFPGRLDEKSIKEADNRTFREKLSDFFSVRGVGGFKKPAPTAHTNPVLKKFENLNDLIEDSLRVGTFLNQTRKGASAQAAGDMSRMLNVDYAPEAFTNFENEVLKKLIPFYSFQRGILPSIREQLIYRPGGGMGQSIRAIDRAANPSDSDFLPERMRRRISVPMPENLFGLDLSRDDGKRYYLEGIQTPFEEFFNTYTPGRTFAETSQNTLGNIAGNLHPALKYLIEGATGRQLYSGVRLQDAYSSLEDALGPGLGGRTAEQFIRNIVPGGSRAMSLFSQAMDDRTQGYEKAIRMLSRAASGIDPLKPVDVEVEKERAFRDAVQDSLRNVPGTKVFENINVPVENLKNMSPRDQQLYLMYRAIQSKAQRRARERKKQEALGLLSS